MARTEEPKPSQPKPMDIPPGMRGCEYALRFGPSRLAAGGTSQLELMCDNIFLPSRLLISSDARAKFVLEKLELVESVGSGKIPLLGSGDGETLPNLASLLSGNAVKMPTIRPGQKVVLTVRNGGPSSAVFECCLMGQGVVKIRERGTAPTYLDRARTPRFSRGRK